MMTRLVRSLACAALLACVAEAKAQASHYAVTFDAKTQSVAVQLCLAQARARVAFAADSGWAMRFISDVKRVDAGAPGAAKVDSGDNGWHALDWRAGECLSYRADLHAIAQEHKPDVGWQMGEDFIAAPQLWLLRPDAQGDVDAEVSIDVPVGWSISAPWRELVPPSVTATIKKQPSLAALSTKRYFRIPSTPPDWSAAVAFGRFTEERIALPGGALRLTVLHGADAGERAKLRAWLDRISRAVLSAYGRLPLPEVQVLVIPVGQLGRSGHGSDSAQAVHFGQSIRGQGNALELLVDPSRPAEEFADDWTAVHELSHLMHPYLGDRGTWLAEGLATYYQNVLRARSGMLTAPQAWDRLYQGFKRGAKTPSDETLEQIASNMHRSHAYQRVYWAGAAYWLTVDRDLRRTSAGKMNLETALSRFRDCCLPAYREWKPEDFVARLDALAGSDVFAPRYREFAAMRQFPDWGKLYSDLGIRDGGEHLAFAADAKDASIREAIMAARDVGGPAAAAGR
ncbi:MAG TPA: hypothetical protein VFI49_00205 [Rudaea sp.]|nr:hypothetical protein [Rudaea sp.]